MLLTIRNNFKIHRVDVLLRLSGLEREFSRAKAANRGLERNWSLVTPWSEEFRYNAVGTSLKTKVEEMIKALDDPNDGVFTWIKKYW